MERQSTGTQYNKVISYLAHPSLRDGEVCVTLCKRRRGWSDISRPTTGAAVMPVRSFYLRSCVHRVASHQSWAEEPPRARWPKHVLSAFPRIGLEMPRLRRPALGRRGTQIPAMEYSGLVWGIIAG